jgi:hypothetical protein
VSQSQKEIGKMNDSIKFIDNAFDKDNLGLYSLNIQLHEHTITVCVTELIKQSAVAVWSSSSKYSLFSKKNTDKTLLTLLNACTIPLKGSYKKISLAIASKEFSFVPSALFDSTEIKKYVELNCGNQMNAIFQHDNLEQEDLNIAYAISKDTIEVLDKTLGIYKLCHHSKVFLNAVNTNFIASDIALYANYSNKQLELIYIKNNKFYFGNIFDVGAPEDFLYFILNSCEQLGINPQDLKLILSGAIKTGDEIHHLAFSYFDKIQFAVAKDSINIAPALTELPKHYFFTAYNQHTCA